MAFSLGGIGASLGGWLSSLVIWGLILVAMVVILIMVLKIRNNMRFVYPCLEIVGLGQGKVSVYSTKAGWFKKNRTFFGLIETGGEQFLMCKDKKRKIFCASSVDYHEINGKRGVICKRKDDDPEVLVPLSRVEVQGLKLLLQIAPADYRDASVDILEEKRAETMSWLQKNAPMLIALGVFIFGLIALIIIFNFAKGESSAWRAFAEASRTIPKTILNSTAP